MNPNHNIIEIKDLSVSLGGNSIHQDLNLSVKKGEILGIVGGSGSGKTTLLRQMLGLLKPDKGSIRVFNKEIVNASPSTLLAVQKRWGVLFQQSALFSSLNILENVAFPLKEHTDLGVAALKQLALIKIIMAGLPVDVANLYPAELSGGMLRRAGLARAIAMDPELLFLDEPTSGLDPNTASTFDDLVLALKNTMGFTIVMITHDLDTLWRVTDRVAFLGQRTVICVETMQELMNNPDPLVHDFFGGTRAKVAQQGQKLLERKQDGN